MSDVDTIIIDSNYLGHRARHSRGGLSYESKGTGVIFGFLSDILNFHSMFKHGDFVFCWDSKKSVRKHRYPWYKLRPALSDEDRESLQDAMRQFDLLRDEILPAMGFRNIILAPGYESDDIFAHIVLKWEGAFVIVTADGDILQLLNHCRIYNPGTGKMMTASRFKNEYGILPSQWVRVKAIGGCKSDLIPGVPRVGEVTAINYLKGELKKTKKVYADIISDEGKAIEDRNTWLVKLPIEEFDIPDKVENEFSMEGFLEVCTKYGMDSFLELDTLRRWESLLMGIEDDPNKKIRKSMGRLGL